MGSAIARILVGSVPSEPRLPAAPSAPVYEIGDDGGSFGSAAAPSVGLCGVTSAAFLLLGAPPAGLRERRRLGGGALERYTARHRAQARWSPRSGGFPSAWHQVVRLLPPEAVLVIDRLLCFHCFIASPVPSSASYLSFARAASRLFNSDSVSARPPLR